MFFYNLRGVIGAGGSAAIAWLAINLLGWGGEGFVVIWGSLMAAFGISLDRVPEGPALRPYSQLFEPVDERVRIALFGAPLVAAPLVLITFGLFPQLQGHPPPSTWFFRWMGISCAASLLAFFATKELRRLPPLPEGAQVPVGNTVAAPGSSPDTGRR